MLINNNLMNSNIYILIYGGIIMYGLMIMIQMFIYNYNNKIYIEIEINKYITSKNNVDIYWIILNCTIIIIITTLNHIINKIGIYNMISYNICYWLIGTGLGLYIAPFVVYGYYIFIYVLDYNIYNLNIHYHNNKLNKYNDIHQIANGTNYNDTMMIMMQDINIIFSIYRGISNLMNWLYQMIYYAIRMWLVFVLHSFSLGSFGELCCVITDQNNILNVFYLGLLGLGIVLYLIVIFYLGIQIYVYISFSLSFLHSTVLLLLVNIIPNVHNNNHNIIKSLSIKSFYLIPVSLVDVININIIFYSIILYILLLFFIPILITHIDYSYHYIYNNYLHYNMCSIININNINTYNYNSIYYLLQLLLIMLIVLSLASLLTVLERKGLASSQFRIGPSYNGWFGLVQIVMDGIKLIYKDYYKYININNKYIFVSGILNFVYSYLLFLFIYADLILYINLPYMILMIIIILMINHITIILCGIVINNSKWTILSSIRLILLYFMYDIIFLIILIALLPNNSFYSFFNLLVDNNQYNITNYILSQSQYINIIKYPIFFYIYMMVVLIEAGRIPVDLIESESELIAGYSIEYAGFLYALFASAEYAIILFHSILISIFFTNYYSFYFLYIQFTIVFIIFIIIRSTLPRFKYTSLFNYTFNTLLPITIFSLLIL